MLTGNSQELLLTLNDVIITIPVSLSTMKCHYGNVKSKLEQFKRLINGSLSETDHNQIQKEKLGWPYKGITGYRLYLGWSDGYYLEFITESKEIKIFTTNGLVIKLSQNMNKSLINWLENLSV